MRRLAFVKRLLSGRAFNRFPKRFLVQPDYADIGCAASQMTRDIHLPADLVFDYRGHRLLFSSHLHNWFWLAAYAANGFYRFLRASEPAADWENARWRGKMNRCSINHRPGLYDRNNSV